MTKRPSIVAGITRDLDLPNIETPPDQPVGAPPAKAAARRANPDIVHTSIYLPREVHRLLREIAYVENKKIHDLIIAGIDEVLIAKGHPPASELRVKNRS